MTNPLLRPDDRFQPRKVGEHGGANPFSEGDAVLEAEAAAGQRKDNSLAAPGDDSSRPFLPQYEMTAEHRGPLLFFLNGVSFVAGVLGIFVVQLGYVLPLLGIIPAVAVIFLAADDLRMMRLGGRNPAGRGLTIAALLVAILFTASIAAMCGLFLYFDYPIVPEWMGM